MFSTNEQKLRDIKALMLPVMKRKLGVKAYGLTDDQLFSPQIPSYTKLFEMNMKWNFRLIKPDVPKEKEVEKNKISTIQAFSAKMRRFAEKDIPERVRQLNRVIIDTKMSPKFFESTLEEATDMMKKAVEPYTDEELMIWETTYTNIWRRKLECDPKLTYGEKMRLLKENYIQSQNNWLKRKMSPSEAEKFWVIL
ncbi:hypothetical protein WR25_16924 [Diploscapter pachys]|uniref:Uncharacterized protein n=1 Tax=Diploscapter pachys TaxID=2018661 RepID=A0A2A2JP99_9BILA|nr:hypothetical protein WR25_16924 [Diploscapter pachys]